MYDNLINTIKTINKSKKIRCFFFGSTVKKETSNFYISSIRENQKFIYGGAIIYSESSGKKIAKIVDGKVDFVLIDKQNAADTYLDFLDKYPLSIFYEDIRLQLRELAN